MLRRATDGKRRIALSNCPGGPGRQASDRVRVVTATIYDVQSSATPTLVMRHAPRIRFDIDECEYKYTLYNAYAY